MTIQLLSTKQLAEALGYHPEYIQKLARKGEIPVALRLGNGNRNHYRFDFSEVKKVLKPKQPKS